MLFGVVLEELRFAEEPVASQLAYRTFLETSFHQRSIQVPLRLVHLLLLWRIKKLLARKDLHRTLTPLSPAERVALTFLPAKHISTELLAQVFFNMPLEWPETGELQRISHFSSLFSSQHFM